MGETKQRPRKDGCTSQSEGVWYESNSNECFLGRAGGAKGWKNLAGKLNCLQHRGGEGKTFVLQELLLGRSGRAPDLPVHLRMGRERAPQPAEEQFSGDYSTWLA